MDIQEISSRDNQYIKLAKFLHQKRGRQETNLFLLEGKTLIEEALKKQIKIQFLFVRNQAILDDLARQAQTQVFELNEDLMARIATTENPPPIVAIAEMPSFADPLDQQNCSKLETRGLKQETEPASSLQPPTSSISIYLFLENISDPGNLGSIIRTAFAAGVKSIYLSPGSVDVFNTKVLRASMGTAFYGPIKYLGLEELKSRIQEQSKENNMSLEIVGTCPRSSKPYQELQFSPFKDVLILIGNESTGLSNEAKELCTQLVSIPLENGVESLNILAATSVILFGLKQ